MKHKILLFLLISSLFTVPVVQAASKQTQQAQGTNSQQGGSGGQNQGSAVNQRTSKDNGQKAQNQVQKCQSIEGGIKARSMNMTQYALKQMEQFSAMTGKVEDYYQRKLKANGIQVPNYDGLKTQAQQQKMAAVQANTQAQNSLLNFDCNSQNPGQPVRDFNKYMNQTKNALKAYQGSVKNLTEAVRTAAQKGGQQ